AEKAIEGLKYKDKNNRDRIDVTTSQIRKFLTAVNVVRNKVDLYKAKNKGAESLSKELTAEIKFLKVNLLYQAGRTAAVEQFMTISKLDVIIDSIGDSLSGFVKFTKYVEALVAYHKFLGGKDK
ncbi:type III-A CRISPR-associated protein Csm2, partial [Phascolarctobacterium succinatutens]|uniref:type III-A CRISPR-associated protein Csm2 n=1 Tax=Phascolarctobacterium succinatutens TaxID=626940 RepID=UPI0026F0C090